MTYAELAERYGVDLCVSADECGLPIDHGRGYGLGHQLHWSLRRVQKRSLYRFLKLIASYRLAGALIGKIPPREYRPAEAIYAINIWAYDTALRDLHIRFPRRYSAEDRARVRSLLVHAPYQVNRRALDWARA